MAFTENVPNPPKRLVWLVDTLATLKYFPTGVRHRLGFALYQAQIGTKPESAKLLRGSASGRSEWNLPRGLYRASSKYGLRPSYFSEEIEDRHSDTAAGYRNHPAPAETRPETGWHRRRLKMAKHEYTVSSGNVFKDLGLLRPDDLLAKAELAAKIISEIQQRGLTQNQAAEILGVDQPKVSALRQGKLSGFSIERLLWFLLLLGRDIEIAVKEKPKTRSVARLRVA